MRIGIYSLQSPCGIYVGGASDYVANLAGGLVDLGHEVHLFVAKVDDKPFETTGGVNLWPVRIHDVPLLRGIQFRWLLGSRLRKVERELGGFDVVQANELLVLQGFRKRTVLTVHHVLAVLERSEGRFSPGLFPLYAGWERRAILQAARIITASDETKGDLLAHYPVDASRLHPIHNGVTGAHYRFDEPTLRRARERLGVEDDSVLLISTPGRIDEERKGLGDLVRALGRLPRDLAWNCVILGTGDKDALEHAARAEGLEGRLLLPGFVDSRTKREWVAAADLFVMTSVLEGCPISLLEALGAGLPVVATRVGGIPELVTCESQGILVPPRDVDALRAAILKLVTDPAMRERMGRFNRSYAAEVLSWERAAQKTLEVYHRVAAEA